MHSLNVKIKNFNSCMLAGGRFRLCLHLDFQNQKTFSIRRKPVSNGSMHASFREIIWRCNFSYKWIKIMHSFQTTTKPHSQLPKGTWPFWVGPNFFWIFLFVKRFNLKPKQQCWVCAWVNAHWHETVSDRTNLGFVSWSQRETVDIKTSVGWNG